MAVVRCSRCLTECPSELPTVTVQWSSQHRQIRHAPRRSTGEQRAPRLKRAYVYTRHEEGEERDLLVAVLLREEGCDGDFLGCSAGCRDAGIGSFSTCWAGEGFGMATT